MAKTIAETFLYPEFPAGIILSDTDMENLVDVVDQYIDLEKYVKQREKEIRSDRMWLWARDNFKNEDGQPWEMSPGELAIFRSIVLREYPRIEIITSTQYGKTLTVSRAVLTRITGFPDEFIVLAPDLKRGQIIIDYMIRDTASNTDFTAMLQGVDLAEKNFMMRLLEERSKVKLTYQLASDEDRRGEPPQYGSVEVLSVQARKRNQVITGIMGFGGRNLISDESALTDDEINAGVYRMMAGKGQDTFWMKIGNPFFRNHFLEDWKDPTFAKIYVDRKVALLEGRYLPEFIEKGMKLPHADVLYDCRFPKPGAVDRKGWIPLFTEDELKAAMVKEGIHFGEERIGADPADEGDNKAAIVKRSAGYAEIVFSEEDIDAYQFAGPVVQWTSSVSSKKAYIDRIGVGTATVGKVNEVNKVEQKGLHITAVNVGENAQDETKFFNRRAELYWRTRQWVKEGGRLSYDERWLQLAKIKYTADEKGRLKIMSKREMRDNNILSPDEADALTLTFYDLPAPKVMTEEDKFFHRKMMENKRKKDGGPSFRMIGR